MKWLAFALLLVSAVGYGIWFACTIASASTDGGEAPAGMHVSQAASPSSLEADEDRCAEDIDANGYVDIFDLAQIGGVFGQHVPADSPYDIDHDGVITVTGDI